MKSRIFLASACVPVAASVCIVVRRIYAEIYLKYSLSLTDRSPLVDKLFRKYKEPNSLLDNDTVSIPLMPLDVWSVVLSYLPPRSVAQVGYTSKGLKLYVYSNDVALSRLLDLCVASPSKDVSSFYRTALQLLRVSIPNMSEFLSRTPMPRTTRACMRCLRPIAKSQRLAYNQSVLRYVTSACALPGVVCYMYLQDLFHSKDCFAGYLLLICWAAFAVPSAMLCDFVLRSASPGRSLARDLYDLIEQHRKWGYVIDDDLQNVLSFEEDEKTAFERVMDQIQLLRTLLDKHSSSSLVRLGLAYSNIWFVFS
jgi:hypothetical protein